MPGTPGSANALDQLLIGYIPLVQCQSVFSAAIKKTVPCLVVGHEPGWVVRGLHEAVVVSWKAAVLLGSDSDVSDTLGFGRFRSLAPVRLLVNTATSMDLMSEKRSRCSTPKWLWVSLFVLKVRKYWIEKSFSQTLHNTRMPILPISFNYAFWYELNQWSLQPQNASLLTSHFTFTNIIWSK